MRKIATFVVLLGLTARPALAKIDVGVDASVKAESDSGAYTVESDATVSSETNTEADSQATIEINTDPIVITASDIDETEVTIASTAEVNSKASLDSYARGVIKANADIRDVIITDEHVAVSHREHARLFGILPIKVFARAYVSNDGSVEVKFPWYAFASAKKAALESRIQAAVSSSVSASANAKLSAKTQAEMLAKTVAAMKAEMDAEAQAKATAKVQ